MNSNRLKQKLEVAIKTGDSPIGKNFGCIISKLAAKEILVYINKLEIKVEKLEKECSDKERAYTDEYVLRKELKTENKNLREQNFILSQKRANIFEIIKAYERGRRDGIKEFAERLNATFPNNSRWVKPRKKIDSILKEMVDDKNK